METMTRPPDAQPSDTGPQRVAVIGTAQLEVALANALLFASTDRARPVLNAVRVDVVANPAPMSGPTRCERALRLVATDSFALVVDYVPADGLEAWPVDGLLLERDGLAEVLKVVKTAAKNRAPVTIEPTGRGVTFATNGQTLEVRAIDGTFPEWERLVPTGTGASVVLFKASMLARLGKLRALGTKTPSVELTNAVDSGKPVRFEVLDSDCYGLAMPAGTMTSNGRKKPGRWSAE